MVDKTKSLNKVYEKDELTYFCNACGDINIPGKEGWWNGKPEELPRTARELYENCWGEGCGLPMYVVEYKCETAMAITALFDESYKDDLLTEKNCLNPSKPEYFRLHRNRENMRKKPRHPKMTRLS